MTRAVTARAAALAAAAIAGGVLAVALGGGEASAPASSPPPPLATAKVIRTDLRTTVLAGGALGYSPGGPLVNQLSGTYTRLPALGARITPGGVLYRVDDVPVTLMVGGTPAWRSFVPGMTDGPDVTELRANLISLGYARGLFSRASGRFDWFTVDSIERWQVSQGEAATGEIDLGRLAFLPAAIRVGTVAVAPGEAASPGQLPYSVTTTTRTVTVPLNPNLPAVMVGDAVSIVLPSSAGTPGRVTAIGSAPAALGAGSPPAAGGAALTVVPEHPVTSGAGTTLPVEVAFTTQSVRHTLAVPVAALLALAGGGYGLEVVEPSGADRLIGVSTGVFAGSEVQVSGAGVAPGITVVVAQ